MRPIDADALKEHIDKLPALPDGNFAGNHSALKALINMQPSVQPEPKEGHWIKHIDPFDGEQYECSECGVLWEFNDGTPEDNEAYFCPKCGAKMKGERQK